MSFVSSRNRILRVIARIAPRLVPHAVQPGKIASSGRSAGEVAREAKPIADVKARTIAIGLAVAFTIIAYLFIGVLGHDPWKQDETYTFGIIHHMMRTGDWIVPTNAGQPFMEKPPLYDWTAIAFASAFGRWLPVFDAARLASAFFMAIALLFLARSVRVFYRIDTWVDARVAGTLALFGSTFVVIKHTHDLMTDVALLAGASIALYALLALTHAIADGRSRAVHENPYKPTQDTTHDVTGDTARAGLWLGLGVGIAMMSKGVFVPLVFGTAAVLLPVIVPACRDRRYAHAIGLSLIVFVPFATIWPIALYHRSPELFKVWFWDNNIGRFFGFSVPQLGAENDKHFFVLRTLLSSALPIGPLALAGIWPMFSRGAANAANATTRDAKHELVREVKHEGWRRLLTPSYAVPLLLCVIGCSVLAVSATARQVYILPFTPALALLAGVGIQRIPRGFHKGWDYVCRILFAAGVTAIWAVWGVMTGPMDKHWWIERLSRWLPLDYALQTPVWVFALAVVLTAAWGIALGLASRAGKWRGVVSWSAGIMVSWCLVFTLLLPWVDYSKSYRSVYVDLREAIAPYWKPDDCMASVSLAESEAPMLELFTGIEHKPAGTPGAANCRWLIIQYEGHMFARPPGDWVPFWGGTRPGDDEQVLRVYRRANMDQIPPAGGSAEK